MKAVRPLQSSLQAVSRRPSAPPFLLSKPLKTEILS